MILSWGIMKCWKKKTLDFQKKSHPFSLNVRKSRLGKWLSNQLWGAMHFLDHVEDDVYADVSVILTWLISVFQIHLHSKPVRD